MLAHFVWLTSVYSSWASSKVTSLGKCFWLLKPRLRFLHWCAQHFMCIPITAILQYILVNSSLGSQSGCKLLEGRDLILSFTVFSVYSTGSGYSRPCRVRNHLFGRSIGMQIFSTINICRCLGDRGSGYALLDREYKLQGLTLRAHLQPVNPKQSSLCEVDWTPSGEASFISFLGFQSCLLLNLIWQRLPDRIQVLCSLCSIPLSPENCCTHFAGY